MTDFRTIDASGNNKQHPEWGMGDTPFLRMVRPAYGDGLNTPSGADRPGARDVSNIVCAQSASIPNRQAWSGFLWQWGQFIDHDMTLSPTADPIEVFDVPVPTGDVYFDPTGTGTRVIELERSYWEPINGVRAQFNELTSYLDASMVYGVDAERAAALRANDGTGRLKTSQGNYLPYNTEGFENIPGGPVFFLAGDIRANEQVALTAIQTLFVREHNFWADRIREEGARIAANSGTPAKFPALTTLVGTTPLDDERTYQLARAIVAAEIQAVTYREFLPALLGPNPLPPYRRYDPNAKPQIRSEFAVAAFRFGHSTLSNEILRLGADGKPIAAGNLTLLQSFFNPEEVVDNGIDPILRGLAAQRPEEIDAYISDAVRNFLFGPPGSGGLDLASLNIQRGRDWGIASYNQVRREIGLKPVRDIAGITPDPEMRRRLTAAYGTPEKVDAWIGMLAEKHMPGAAVGETVATILRAQFAALRDGDRYWYQSYLSPEMQRLVESQKLSDIIRRNTAIGAELQPDVFRLAKPKK